MLRSSSLRRSKRTAARAGVLALIAFLAAVSFLDRPATARASRLGAPAPLDARLLAVALSAPGRQAQPTAHPPTALPSTDVSCRS